MDSDIRRDDMHEDHATTGGSAAAGAVTGGIVGGMGAGPVGAAVGAVGGAIVGAAGERAMHADDDRTWDDDMPRFRDRWQQSYGSRGGTWTDYEPGYRYGWEMSRHPDYRGRSWDDLEPTFRGDWETRFRDRPWDTQREHIRDAWEEGGRTMQLREEELIAQKRMRETGHVSVEKDVVTEHRTMDVPVTREEVVIERRPVDRRPTDQPIGTDAEGMEVVLHEEEVDVQKRPVVYEEVEVGKRTTQETRHVEADVRREVADVRREGDTEVRRP